VIPDHDGDDLSQLARELAARSAAIAPDLADHVVRTPLVRFADASELSGATLLVKSEHLQRTGSFKIRGALAKILSLSPDERARGVVTASSGNHGLGIAHALRILGGTGIVCVPEGASPAKLRALARHDVEVRTLDASPDVTETSARALAEELGRTFVSPYNDPAVIAGQGTIGVEILAQLGRRRLDAVVVAVGGGGLVSGIASVVKSALPDTRIVGASPANDAAMAASVQAGQIVDIEAKPTLSDGTAGGIEPGSITFPLCSELVDEWSLVTEQQIRDALRLAIDTEHQLLEGAAATSLAAAIELGRENPGSSIAVVSCGANISSSTLRAALDPVQE
jgi:threonine dehydratase